MKLRKSERIGAIVKVLSDNPNKIFTLGYFTEKFDTAKSTLSEDISVVKNVFEKLELGKVITISGASGGIKFIPMYGSLTLYPIRICPKALQQAYFFVKFSK